MRKSDTYEKSEKYRTAVSLFFSTFSAKKTPLARPTEYRKKRSGKKSPASEQKKLAFFVGMMSVFFPTREARHWREHGHATRGIESGAGTRPRKHRDGSPRPRSAAVELAGRATGARGGGRPRAENIAGGLADARTPSGVRPGRPRVPDVRRGQPERVIGHRRAAGASGDFRGPTPGPSRGPRAPRARDRRGFRKPASRNLRHAIAASRLRRTTRAEKTRGPRVPELLARERFVHAPRAAAAQKRRRERLGVPPAHAPSVTGSRAATVRAMPRANRRRFFLSGVAALPRSRDGFVSCGVCACAVFATVETRKKRFRFRSRDFRFQRLTIFPFAPFRRHTNTRKKKKTRSSGGWSCVPVPELDAWFRAHSHADAVNGPPPASSSDLAAIARRFVGSQGTPPKPAARASVGECGGETESERSAVSRADSFTEEARTPTGRSRFFGFGEAVGTPSCAPETEPTSVDDLVDRAVALVRGQQAVRRRGAHTTISRPAFGFRFFFGGFVRVSFSGFSVFRLWALFPKPFRLWALFLGHKRTRHDAGDAV